MTRESFGLRIDATDGPVRVWNGVGDLPVPADAIEAEPAVYWGGGELLNAPDFQQLIGGVAERLDIEISGANREMVRLAREDAEKVKGARVDFVRFDFDSQWQLENVEYETIFTVDTLRVQSEGGEARTRTIILSISSDNTDRSHAPVAFFTDADQRSRPGSTDDAIFSHVAAINSGTSRRFGPKQ